MGNKKLSVKERWHEQVETFKRKAEKLPYGKEREELMRKARQLQTASDFNEWVSSPSPFRPK